jgi:ketosteroid isomerase-like protein
MKRNAVLMSTSLVVLLSVGGKPQSSGSESPTLDSVAQIRALEAAANEAIFRGDVAAIEKMTSEDYTFITPRGMLLTRAEVLKGVANGAFENEYREAYDLNIRVYGDAAVVTGRTRLTRQEGGKDYRAAYRFTRVYVRQQGTWRAVALQAGREEALAGVN